MSQENSFGLCFEVKPGEGPREPTPVDELNEMASREETHELTHQAAGPDQVQITC